MSKLLRTMTTYGILWTASDITQELVVSQKVHVDWGKTARIAATGAFVTAPLVHNWLHLVEMILPGNSMKVILKKVVTEQICFAPVAITSFYFATCTLEGKSCLSELKTKFKPTYLTGLSFWPFFQMFNFRFMPHQYKPLAIASASFLWSMYLCFMKEEDTSKETHILTPSKLSLELSQKD